MHPNINLLHLKFFCDTVHHNSVSEAAKLNYVTQSTVSQAIVKLERILGVDLITHARQKVRVTPEGKMVCEQARQVFKAIQNIYDVIDRQRGEISGSVNFISTNSLGISFLAPLHRKIQEMLPKVQPNFRLGGLNFIRQALRQGEAEFAIVVHDSNFARFESIPLRKGKFYLYVHEEAQYRVGDNLYVDNSQGMYVNELTEYLKKTDLNPTKKVTELAAWEVVARYTEMNLGIGFFPDYLMDHGRYPMIKPLILELPAFEYEICAIYNKGERLSNAAQALLSLLAQAFKEE